MDTLKYSVPVDKKQNLELRKEFSQRLANRLRELRKAKGIMQEDLAVQSGIDITYISHLEASKYHPTVYVMWKIAKALGVTLNDLTDF